MAKKSQRRPARRARDSAGCIWGLINIFDFRHGQPTTPLLADRKRVSKQAFDAEPSRIEKIASGPAEIREYEEDVEEEKTALNDVAKISVKKLMEEEMNNEERLTNKSNDSEECLEQTDPKRGLLVKKNHEINRRTSSKSSDLDAATCLKTENFQRDPHKKISDNLDLDTIVEVLTQINQRNLNQNDLDKPCIPAVTAVDEKLVAAIKLCLEQKMSRGQNFEEDGKSCCSRELVDALQRLSSNKGLFLKLLKDPNSVIVNDIGKMEVVRLEEDQPTNCISGSNLSQDKPVNLRADENNKRKHHNFFRRRSKSLESFPVVRDDDDSQSSRKIVVLKPGPAETPEADIAFSCMSLHSRDMDNEVHNARNASHFSFSEIKRKLRNAIGMERQGISQHIFSSKQQNMNNGDKGATGENLGWSSPNRNHFYTEKFAKSLIKKAEMAGKSKDDSSAVVNGASNIYVEAKKHLSEILNNGEAKTESMSMRSLKSLGRVLSLTEFNSSPCCSPRKPDSFTTAQMRLSPRGVVKKSDGLLLQEDRNSNPHPSGQNLESDSDDKLQSPNANDDISTTHDQEYYCETQSFSGDTTVLDEIVRDSSSRVVDIEEETGLRPPEEERILDNASELSSSSTTTDIQSRDIRVDNNESTCEFLKNSSGSVKLDCDGEDQALFSPAISPSYPSRNREVEESERIIDKMERPSPVSILEPLFTDDEISPAKSISHSVDEEIQPRQIHFEDQHDQGICTRISLEDEESAFEYVEAVLLGSGLNWDEFLLRWLSLCEILDSSLFDEVELFSSRPHDDQKLLFDCANEALKEVCEKYFGCFVAVSPAEHSMKSVPKGMELIQEVWHRVEWHLLQNTRPHSLDNLIRSDMESSGKWMNLQYDIEGIGFEIGDDIFEELMEDTILGFLDDSSYCDFRSLRADPVIIEESNL